MTRSCSAAVPRTIRPALPPQPNPICDATRSVSPMRLVFMVSRWSGRPSAFDDARRLQAAVAQDFAEHVTRASELDARDHVIALARIGRGKRNGLHLHRRQ